MLNANIEWAACERRYECRQADCPEPVQLMIERLTHQRLRRAHAPVPRIVERIGNERTLALAEEPPDCGQFVRTLHQPPDDVDAPRVLALTRYGPSTGQATLSAPSAHDPPPRLDRLVRKPAEAETSGPTQGEAKETRSAANACAIAVTSTAVAHKQVAGDDGADAEGSISA